MTNPTTEAEANYYPHPDSNEAWNFNSNSKMHDGRLVCRHGTTYLVEVVYESDLPDYVKDAAAEELDRRRNRNNG